MKLWKTILFIVVAIGIGYFAIKEYQKSVIEEEIEKISKELITTNLNDLKGFSIIHPETTIVVERGHWRQWNMVMPVRFTVEPKVLKQFLEKLDFAKIEMVIDEPDINLDDYGFGEDRLAIALDFSTAADETLYFGEQSPTKKFVYVKKSGDNRILTTEAILEKVVAVPYKSLKDHYVSHFFLSDLDSLSWVRNDTTFTITQVSPAYWMITSPLLAECDQKEAMIFLNYLRELTIQSDIATKTDDLAQYGLDEPQLTFTLTPKHQMDPITVMIGKRHEEKSFFYYAKRKNYDIIFTVFRDIIVKLSKPIYRLREKTIANFMRNEVDNIELTVDGKLIRYIKDAEGKWSMVYPHDVSVPENDINIIFRISKFLKIQEFVREQASPQEMLQFGFDDPKVILKIKKGNTVIVEYQMGNPHKERKDRYYLRTSGSSKLYAINNDMREQADYFKKNVYGE